MKTTSPRRRCNMLNECIYIYIYLIFNLSCTVNQGQKHLAWTKFWLLAPGQQTRVYGKNF